MKLRLLGALVVLSTGPSPTPFGVEVHRPLAAVGATSCTSPILADADGLAEVQGTAVGGEFWGLPAMGCWRIHTRRDNLSGDIRLNASGFSSSRCPSSSTHGMGGPGWGWVGTGGVRALSAWSGRHATLNVGELNSGFVQKVLWQMRRSLRQVVTLRGRNLRTGKPIRFQFADQGPGTQPVGAVAHLDPRYPNAMSSSPRDRGWLGYSSEIILPSLGCYVLHATWNTGGWTMTFATRGASSPL